MGTQVSITVAGFQTNLECVDEQHNFSHVTLHDNQIGASGDDPICTNTEQLWNRWV
jgi:hypothetical protein